MNKVTPINKGNYSMDTLEREELFERYRGDGWESEYRDYRRHWTEFPEKQYVAQYPLLVDAELSSLCNLKCPMCYTITDDFKSKVKTTLMEFDLFRKIIDEIGGKVPSLRLSLRGEPLLHPRVLECVRYAKQKGIREVSFLTNGSKLSSQLFVKLMDAGLDWITISIDGLGSVYESIRKPLKFDDLLQKVKDIREIKKKANRNKPVIKIQTIWPAIRNNPVEYYNCFAPYVDLIAFNPLIDYLHADSDIVYLDNFVCPQPYQRLVIGADGAAMMCSNDEENTMAMGDANKQTIHDIWHGERLQNIRNQHVKKGGFEAIPVCRKCYLPRKTEDKESAVINGRVFTVKNYVNRNQQVGT